MKATINPSAPNRALNLSPVKETINDRASATEYLERGLRALFIFQDESDIADRIHTVPSAIAQSLLEEYL